MTAKYESGMPSMRSLSWCLRTQMSPSPATTRDCNPADPVDGVVGEGGVDLAAEGVRALGLDLRADQRDEFVHAKGVNGAEPIRQGIVFLKTSVGSVRIHLAQRPATFCRVLVRAGALCRRAPATSPAPAR